MAPEKGERTRALKQEVRCISKLWYKIPFMRVEEKPHSNLEYESDNRNVDGEGVEAY